MHYDAAHRAQGVRATEASFGASQYVDGATRHSVCVCVRYRRCEPGCRGGGRQRHEKLPPAAWRRAKRHQTRLPRPHWCTAEAEEGARNGKLENSTHTNLCLLPVQLYGGGGGLSAAAAKRHARSSESCTRSDPMRCRGKCAQMCVHTRTHARRLVRQLHGIIKLWCQIKATSPARRPRRPASETERTRGLTLTAHETRVFAKLCLVPELNHEQPKPRGVSECERDGAIESAKVGALCPVWCGLSFPLFLLAGLCALSLTFIMTHTRARLN